MIFRDREGRLDFINIFIVIALILMAVILFFLFYGI